MQYKDLKRVETKEKKDCKKSVEERKEGAKQGLKKCLEKKRKRVKSKGWERV